MIATTLAKPGDLQPEATLALPKLREVPAELIYLDTADERQPHVLTPAEAADRRLRVACPGAYAEAEREEYIERYGEEPPEDDDYEPPVWEE